MTAATRKLPRVVRLDESDNEVYERAAEPGEWAVPGGFEFLEYSEQDLSGKKLQAFRGGFLGIGSFGRATLVAVTAASEHDYRDAIERLADHLLDHFGAPDRDAALRAAGAEVAYAETLCEHGLNTLLAMERELTDDGVSERFKKFTPTGAGWDQGKPLVYVEEEV